MVLVQTVFKLESKNVLGARGVSPRSERTPRCSSSGRNNDQWWAGVRGGLILYYAVKRKRRAVYAER